MFLIIKLLKKNNLKNTIFQVTTNSASVSNMFIRPSKIGTFTNDQKINGLR